MASQYKGVRMGGAIKPTNMGNMKVQKAVDFIELVERGLITEPHEKPSTSGVGHKKSGGKFGSAIGATSVDMGRLDSVSGITYDYGAIATAALTEETSKWAVRRAVASSRAQANAIPAGPAAASWTKTWDLATDWPTLSNRVIQTESLRVYTGNIAGIAPYSRSKHTWSADGYFLYVSGTVLDMYGQPTVDYWLQREVSTRYDASPSAVVEDKSVHLTAAGAPTTPIDNGRMRKHFHVVNNGNNTVSYLGHENGYLSYGKTLYMDDLATANDITSVSFTTTNYYDMGNDIANGSNGPEQVQFNSDGTAMYVLFHLGLEYNSSTGQFNADNDTNSKSSIIKYTLSTAWDLTTASTTSTSFYNFSSPGRFVGLSFAMNPDETEFFAFVEEGSTKILMLEFNIPTAGDLSSIPAYLYSDPTNVYRQLFDGVNQDTRSLTMSPDGKTITTWAGTAHIVVNLENPGSQP